VSGKKRNPPERAGFLSLIADRLSRDPKGVRKNALLSTGYGSRL